MRQSNIRAYRILDRIQIDVRALHQPEQTHTVHARRRHLRSALRRSAGEETALEEIVFEPAGGPKLRIRSDISGQHPQVEIPVSPREARLIIGGRFLKIDVKYVNERRKGFGTTVIA